MEQESWQRDNLCKENKMGRPGRGKDNKGCYACGLAFGNINDTKPYIPAGRRKIDYRD